jgi:hypothetical protein
MMLLPANHRVEDFHTDKTPQQSETLPTDQQSLWQDSVHVSVSTN